MKLPYCVAGMVAVLALAAASRAAEMSGRVVDEEGKAVANAIVYIHSVAPESEGRSRPSAYPDWAKTAVSDGEGKFVLEGLDAKLKYALAVVAEGHPTLMIKRQNPRPDLEAKLVAMPEARKEASHQFRGRLIDSDGKPVFGAEVRPIAMRRADGNSWRGPDKMDELTVTDKEGKFVLACDEENWQVGARILSRQHARQVTGFQSMGEEVHEFTLSPGSTIKGKLMKEGKGVPHVTVGAVQTDRTWEKYTGEREAVTDDQGAFIFEHVNSNDKYMIYTTMKTAKALGAPFAMKIQEIATEDDGSTAEAGDVELVKGLVIAGRVKVTEGEEMPKEVTLDLRRNEAPDGVQTKVDAEGKFKIEGVPAEEVLRLTVRARGYRLSRENESIDPFSPDALTGQMTENTENLEILVEKGEVERRQSFDQSDVQRRNGIRGSPMRGVEGKQQ
ncbi:MAG TPA: carboxypeptidase-like regulatory domain-containing protein [Tepidisphaeraceae bacterium]|jgi:hypothetical protein